MNVSPPPVPPGNCGLVRGVVVPVHVDCLIEDEGCPIEDGMMDEWEILFGW